MNGSVRPPARRRGGTTTIQAAERGFSVLELLVIIIIVGVLAAIAVPSLHARAKATILDANLRTLAETVGVHVLEGYSAEYRPSGEGDPTYHLSALLEETLGTAGYVNPAVGEDGGRAVLNRDSVPSDPDSAPPAVFITNAAQCLHESFSALPEGDRRLLAGALVVAFNPGAGAVEVFYVDEDGQPSASMVSVSTT